MIRRFAAILFGVAVSLACGGVPPTDAVQPADEQPTPEEEVSVLHEAKVAGGVLRWTGMVPPEGTPKTFGVEKLAFTSPTAAGEFTPEGTLQFSDWSFDVVSPDGAWVVLLQDRHGPYHAVRSERLAAYLSGEHGPDRVIAYEGKGDFRPVFQKQRWTAPHTFHYVEAGESKEAKTIELD